MISLVVILFRSYEMLIVVRVILTWVQADMHNPIVDLIYRLTEPILGPIRRLIHVDRMAFDISPLIVIFLLEVVERMLIRSIF
jgi:YggT family protein